MIERKRNCDAPEVPTIWSCSDDPPAAPPDAGTLQLRARLLTLHPSKCRSEYPIHAGGHGVSVQVSFPHASTRPCVHKLSAFCNL